MNFRREIGVEENKLWSGLEESEDEEERREMKGFELKMIDIVVSMAALAAVLLFVHTK
jgi:hypothetical protein